VRRRPDLTRAQLGHELRLATGPTSDLLARLRAAHLLTEQQAPREGPGRPTTTLHAHPHGPIALAVDIRHGDWRVAMCHLDGSIELLRAQSHAGDGPDAVIAQLRRHIAQARRRHDSRVIAVGVTVAGQTAGSRLLHASTLGWRDVDLAPIAQAARAPMIVGNDATMAALAEARAHRARVLLHVVVEVGLGGALVIEGRPAPSAHSLHGEFGHLPFGDPSEQCHCGASGCWEIPFDPRHAAARLRQRPPRDPRSWLADVLEREAPSKSARELRQALAASLGRGCAGLINALDPDVVTLGGLAGAVRGAAPARFDESFASGLMAVHREAAPAVMTALAGENAALIGAGLAAFDRVLDAARLARWAAAGDGR